MSSEAPNAAISMHCKSVSSVIYIRWWLAGRGAMWNRLAININGRSQVDKTRRGADRESTPTWREVRRQPRAHVEFSQAKLFAETTMLCAITTVQSQPCEINHVVGIINRVMTMSFSIVEGWGFGVGRSHVFGQWQLGGKVLRLLHKPKMLAVAWGLLRNL